jgi:16S rRNA (cytosine967-C5)-methyltransferase
MSATAVRASSRDVALAVVRDVFGPEHRAAQASFDFRVRRAELAPRDRAFAAELAYGTIKMRRTIDWYLRPYLERRAQPLPAPIAEALRTGVYQVRFMHGVEPHAAVFETVNAAMRVGHRGTAGLVNAVLRRLIADDPRAPAREDFQADDDYLATRYSVPTWIAAQWRERLGERLEEALQGIDGPPQLGIRVNALRATVLEVADELGERGIVTRASSLAADSLVVDARPDVPIGDDEAGRWSIQSEASCIPVDLLEPQPGERVVDLCSGRGNKAVQIAARMRNDGALSCVEIDEQRVCVLEERLARAGATCANVTLGDAARAGDEPVADAVLIDAPCSGLGILGRHPESRWRKSPDDGARLAANQAALIEAGAARTRPGGRLVYSVCTTDKRECEDVVDALMAARPEFVREPPPERYVLFATPSGDVVVPPGIEGRDGFYIARLRRAVA